MIPSCKTSLLIYRYENPLRNCSYVNSLFSLNMNPLLALPASVFLNRTFLYVYSGSLRFLLDMPLQLILVVYIILRVLLFFDIINRLAMVREFTFTCFVNKFLSYDACGIVFGWCGLGEFFGGSYIAFRVQ